MPPSDLHGYQARTWYTNTHEGKDTSKIFKNSLNILGDIFTKYINSNKHFL